jgi:hypothetical protein
MKKWLLILIILTSFILILTLFSQEFTYVGAGKCKICHKTEKQGRQYPIWEESKHSQSFQALNTDKALEISQSAGIENPAESPECLKCHGSLYEKAPDFKEEAVTCEICHGPGSAYKKLSIMKNREEAVQNGLIVYESLDAVKNHCLTCHEMAHNQPFDFAQAWDKIKHPRPEEKEE